MIATHHPFSVPHYPIGQPSSSAREHLLITQDDGQAMLAARSRELPQVRCKHLALPDYGTQAALQLALGQYLKSARVGLRLELCGDEAFVWPLHTIARGAGLQHDEIILNSCAGSIRRVFCVHCATCQLADAASQLTCCRCGVVLEVRQHFSRHLGAYLGVCADADQPRGELQP